MTWHSREELLCGRDAGVGDVLIDGLTKLDRGTVAGVPFLAAGGPRNLPPHGGEEEVYRPGDDGVIVHSH